jgi:hypothetical protein
LPNTLKSRKTLKPTTGSFLAVDAAMDTTLLPGPFFTKMVSSERNRVERSGGRLVFMLVESPSLLRLETQTGAAEKIQYALSLATRETDIKGWYQDGAVIGVIFTEIPLSEASVVQILSRKVNHALHAVLGEQVSDVNCSFHVFPDHSECDEGGAARCKTALTSAPVRAQ